MFCTSDNQDKSTNIVTVHIYLHWAAWWLLFLSGQYSNSFKFLAHPTEIWKRWYSVRIRAQILKLKRVTQMSYSLNLKTRQDTRESRTVHFLRNTPSNERLIVIKRNIAVSTSRINMWLRSGAAGLFSRIPILTSIHRSREARTRVSFRESDSYGLTR